MRRLTTTLLLAGLPLAVFAGVSARPPNADQILRKAEEIRNPDLDYAVDFTIHGVSRGDTPGERDASYSMLARGKDRTVILMRSPDPLFGALVLMVEDRYWMLLPKASKTWELSGAQMQNGDVATGDLARANLTRGYTATLSGEEDLDGEPCFRLTLEPDAGSAHYARIVYWVAKNGFFPRVLDHYGRTGKLLKTVRYFDYRKGALGVRSMRLTIESLDEWKESSTLVFSNLRKIDLHRSSFAPEGMIPLRDAALTARDAAGADDVPWERILRTLKLHRDTDARH
jgi:hypothetical protein